MADPNAFDQIRASRDQAIAALNDAMDQVSNQIAQTTETGPFLDRLTKRFQDLANERAAIFAAATDAVLALPAVIAAAATLASLSDQMKATAAELPAATDILGKVGSILAIGQQFADIIATAQKG